MSCLIAGDSIAVGVGNNINHDGRGLRLDGPVCSVNAKRGIPSGGIVSKVSDGYDVVVISAGSNDPQNPHLVDNLRAIRKRCLGSKIIWIVPQVTNENAAKAVKLIAAEYGDKWVGFLAGKDHIHPKDYRKLSHQIEELF